MSDTKELLERSKRLLAAKIAMNGSPPTPSLVDAGSIRGKTVDDSEIGDGKVLAYNGIKGTIGYVLKRGGGGGGGGGAISPASYIIYKENTTYFASPCFNGGIPYSGADAATLINQTITALAARGGLIFFKSADYTLNTPITLNRNGVDLTGESWYDTASGGVRFLLADNANCNMINVTGRNNSLRNLFLYGNKTNQGGGTYSGIVWSGEILNADHVYVYQAKSYGWFLSGSVTFLRANCANSNAVGYHLESSYGYHKWTELCSVTNTTCGYEFHDTNKAELVACASNNDVIGVRLDGTTVDTVVNACHLESCGDYGIIVNAASHCVLSNNTINGDSKDTSKGVYLYNGTDILVNGNSIRDCTTGVDQDDGDDCMINNNMIRDCTTPIDINDADAVRTMIMGNNWYGCTNDANIAAATTPRITANIDKTGAWWATGDAPS